ncbi:MBL fold metallo-hydrolase [Thioclava sp. SK-1]|uniref:MBL fold metallo-hydrolase n=1 Tax=Thioclava sp. SK-1 TaxID=1889770 RepID=UPI000824B0AE|nr:MBL fold metallo-hydrolase [Thioclava sp. SK-1]OCX67181.1 MBL fold metallo-hydrolase [Thioclava sp. SK-1]
MPADITRRTAMITATAAVPLGAVALAGSAAQAQTTTQETTDMPPAIPPYRRLTIGAFTVTPLLAGTRSMENPHGTFGTNASKEEFDEISAENFIPSDASLNGFTPVLVETGTETILFDTGLTADGMTAALHAAGKSAQDITHVVITHMHGDHIGGVMTDGTPTFPNAEYLTGQVEFDHWSQSGNEMFEANIRPLADQFTFLNGGDNLRPGITAIEAFGHTPGMLAFLIESDGARLMLTADTVNHYVWSLQKPEWTVRFDMDSDAAAATRKALLGRIAEEKLPFIGYHMPFPGVGFLEPKGDGFRFIPMSYQFNL